MKKAVVIVVILAVIVVIYWYFNKKISDKDLKVSPDNLSGDQQVAIVVNLIDNTPGWGDYIEKMGKDLVITDDKSGKRTLREIISFGSYDSKHKTPVPKEMMKSHEARRHLKLRGLADIQDHPNDFAKYPRGTTYLSQWQAGL